MLTKYYRKAEEIRTERKNHEMWLQGMYIYDAISRVSPILHAFAKRGTKAKPYVEQPYPVTKKTVEDAETKKAKLLSQKGLQYFGAFMAKNNKHFEERK